MRVNIYAEEMPEEPRLEIIEKEVEGHKFTALRIYLELPATVPSSQILLDRATSKPMVPQEVQGPFMHRPGDDDSAAVTFWGKRDLRNTLRRALKLLNEHYDDRDQLPVTPEFKARSERAAIRSLRHLEQTAIMLEKYAPEIFPKINEQGQKHFGRVMMESAAEEIRGAWAKAVYEVETDA